MHSVVADALARGESAISDLLGRTESFSLEFKSKTKPTSIELDKSDKKNIGASLSAFSNADGGLLILGIETQRKDGLDIAFRLSPIADVVRFKNEVDGRLDELLRPANPGIKTHAIEASDGSSCGFLLVDIERSANRPHMSMAPDHQKYFRRSGSQTIFMDHSLVRDLMFARRNSHLEGTWNITGKQWKLQNSENLVGRLLLELRLKNVSPIMASMPYARIWIDPILQHQQAVKGIVPQVRPDGSVAYYASRDVVIHPEDEILFATFNITAMTPQAELRAALRNGDYADLFSPEKWAFATSDHFENNKLRFTFDTLTIRRTIGAENCPLGTQDTRIDKSTLIRQSLPHAITGMTAEIEKITALEDAMERIRDISRKF